MICWQIPCAHVTTITCIQNTLQLTADSFIEVSNDLIMLNDNSHHEKFHYIWVQYHNMQNCEIKYTVQPV